MSTQRTITAKEISTYLGAPLEGSDCKVTHPASLDSANHESVVFANRPSDSVLASVKGVGLALVKDDFPSLQVSHVRVPNPRLAMTQVLREFFTSPPKSGVASSAIVEKGAEIHSTSVVEHHTVVRSGAKIGPGCRVGPNVTIGERAELGENCVISAGAVIGETGFAAEFEGKVPVSVPHLGRTILGARVEVGPNSVISCGMLDDVTIGDDVKIDGQVFVGHNSTIGANSLLIAGSVICGSVRVGENVWVGPGSTTMHKIHVDDGALLGIGAVVTKNVPKDITMMATPARPLPARLGKSLGQNKKK